MNEIELLRKLVELEQSQNTLEVKIDIWGRDSDVTESKQELNEVLQEISETKNSLEKIENKEYSRKAKKAMLDQIGAYVSEINKAKTGLKLSRNQGLILENQYCPKRF